MFRPRRPCILPKLLAALVLASLGAAPTTALGQPSDENTASTPADSTPTDESPPLEGDAPEAGTEAAGDEGASPPSDSTGDDASTDREATDDGRVSADSEDSSESAESADSKEGSESEESAEDETSARTYSLDELIEAGLVHSPIDEESEARLQDAEWKQFRARYAWVPRLSTSTLLAPVPADANPNAIDENFDEIASLALGPYLRTSVRLLMPLYTFGKGATYKQLAAVGIDVSKLEGRKQRLELIFNIKRAYYSAQLARGFSDLIGRGEKILADKLVDMKEARQFGEADFEIEDYRKLQIFKAELDVRALDNQKLDRLSRAGIAYLTGTNLESSNIPALDPDAALPALHGLERYREVARSQRPEIRQLAQAEEASKLKVDLERSNFFPNIFFAANFGWGWSTEEPSLQRVCRSPVGTEACVNDPTLRARPWNNPFDYLSFGVALGIRWRIDFVQQIGKYNEAKAQKSKVSAQRERALGAIELQIRKLYIEAAQARRKIDIQKRRLKAARRWRDQMGLSIETAGADLKDAVDALKAFYQARVLYMQAHYDYRIARARLAQAIGVADLSEVSAPGSSTEDRSE